MIFCELDLRLATVSMAERDQAPNLLPVTLVLTVVLWLFTMTGGRDIFVKEVLGGAYDSQAEHFLRGDVGVDSAAIGHETMNVNGKVRMYFGPFPALLRIPLNFIYPAGAREMVADLRVLRGSHRTVCVCRAGADSVAFIPAFVART